jgi:hypothetical protein
VKIFHSCGVVLAVFQLFSECFQPPIKKVAISQSLSYFLTFINGWAVVGRDLSDQIPGIRVDDNAIRFEQPAFLAADLMRNLQTID